MLDGVAYCHAEGEQDDLRNGEERGTEDDITDGPAVLKSAEDEDQLRDNVHHGADEWPENVDDP